MESLRQKQEFIDVKTAVQTALDHVRQLYEGNEKIRNLGLEEVKLSEDGKTWSVTVGFSRPWSEKSTIEAPLLAAIRESNPLMAPVYPIERDYKQVKIDARSGEIRGMEIRKL